MTIRATGLRADKCGSLAQQYGALVEALVDEQVDLAEEGAVRRLAVVRLAPLPGSDVDELAVQATRLKALGIDCSVDT